MKTNPAVAAFLVLASSLTAGAPSAPAVSEHLLRLKGISGETTEGRAQIVKPPTPAALLAQARAGSLEPLELQVGPGPLRDALHRASEAGSRFELTTEVRDGETYLQIELENVLITSYTLGASDGSVRVGLVPGRFEVIPRPQGNRSAQATGTVQTPPPPVIPSKRPGTGNPDQGFVPGPLPDLEIEAVVPATGSKNAVVATVRNSGFGPAAATQLQLFVPVPRGRELTAQAPVAALAAGQSIAVEIGAGDQTIVEATLRVDDPNVVGESDELNNEFQYTAGK